MNKYYINILYCTTSTNGHDTSNNYISCMFFLTPKYGYSAYKFQRLECDVSKKKCHWLPEIDESWSQGSQMDPPHKSEKSWLPEMLGGLMCLSCWHTPPKFNRNSPWKVTLWPNREPDRLPTTIFQGRAVKLLGGYGIFIQLCWVVLCQKRVVVMIAGRISQLWMC